MRPLPAVVYREHSLGPAPGQTLVNGLVIFLAICTILHFGADILIPVALAILLSILLAPMVRGLQRLRLPKAVAVMAGHGALNFSAALSVSALLRLRHVPHRLLPPPQSVQPGKFPDEAALGVRMLWLCHLSAPSEAKHAYLERRSRSLNQALQRRELERISSNKRQEPLSHKTVDGAHRCWIASSPVNGPRRCVSCACWPSRS